MFFNAHKTRKLNQKYKKNMFYRSYESARRKAIRLSKNSISLKYKLHQNKKLSIHHINLHNYILTFKICNFLLLTACLISPLLF